MAVSGALRAGRGGFRAVRATERRQVGCGRPSTGSGWWWGVALGIVVEGSTFFSFFAFFSFFSFFSLFSLFSLPSTEESAQGLRRSCRHPSSQLS